jgi:manganese oxidase
MTMSRRSWLQGGIAAGALAVARKTQAQGHQHQHPTPAPTPTQGRKPLELPPPKPVVTPPKAPAGERYAPVIVPDGRTLPFETKGGVKIFHLIAEPVRHQFAPGLDVDAWGYNGGTPGPLIEAVVGDRVRIYVTNKLPEPTTVHWHGVILPNGMDGVAGLTQENIQPGKTFRYEFTFKKSGTFMYHPHFDEMTQIALGMMGMIVVHPKEPPARRVRDYSLMLGEWKVPIGASRPDPMAMSDFNILTLNSKAFPATSPLVAETGDLVRIRIGNVGPMDHHPIHLHGHTFELTETDGGQVSRDRRIPETTILVPVGTARVIEFVADNAGDWPIHCHMTHHVMNQMGHDAPNLIGVDVKGVDERISRIVPGYMTMGETGMGDMMTMKQPRNSISMLGGKGPFDQIDMGGMFTIVKVRDKLTEQTANAWYEHPKGTVADIATAEELARDGIKI